MKSVYDYGVLMVHGIGESRRAETLVRFAEPLIAAIQEIVGGDSAPKKTVRTADLYGQGSPAHAEVEFSGTRPKDGEEFSETWLFAEAWWAESFPTPTYKEIMSWATEIIPSTLVAHFEARFRRQGYEFDQWRSETWRQRGILLSRWIGESLWLLLGLLLVPLVLLAVGATLLLGLVPVNAVRDFVGKMQRQLSTTLGDSYVFMGREISAASIVGTVEKDFHWLSTRCRAVAVVAHSQGAAVSHRALRNRPLRPSDLFVTLGSGLRKLTEIDALRAKPVLAQARSTIWAASGAALVSGLVGIPWIFGFGYGELWRRLVVAGSTVFVTIVLGSVMILLRPDKGSSGADTRNRLWLLVFLAICGGLAWLASGWAHPASPWQGGVSTFLVAGGLATAFTSLIRWRRQTGRSTHEAKQANIERELFRKRYRFATSGLEWWDFYASDDPVSNGPLLDSRYLPENFQSTEIRNLDSLIRDHTTYWKNLDGFVRPLARRLLAKREACWPNFDEDFVATRRRRWRVRWLVWARRTLASLAVGLFLLATAQERPWSAEIVERYEKVQAGAADGAEAPIERKVEAEANAEVNEVDAKVDHEADDQNEKAPTLIGVLFGDDTLKDYLLQGAGQHPHRTAAVLSFLYWAVAYAVVVFFWGLWNGRETRGLASYRYFSLHFCGLLAAFAFVSGLAFVLALGEWYGAIAGVPIVFAWLAILVPGGVYGTVEEIVQSRIAAGRQRLEVASSDPVEIGWQLYNEGAVKEALETWEMAWREEQNAEAAYLLCRYLESGRAGTTEASQDVKAKAREAAEFAVGRDHPWAAVWLAELSFEDERWADAVEYYQKAQDLLQRQGAGAGGDALDVGWLNIPIALALEQDGKKEEATALLTAEMDAGNGDAALQLGRNAMSADQPTPDELGLALRYFSKAVQLGESSAAIAMSEAFIRLDDIRSAREVLQFGADLGVAGCYQALGELELEQEGDADAAFEAYKKERDRNPDSFEAAEALYRLGQIQEKRGRLPAAKRYYRKAVGHPIRAHGPAATALGKLLEAERDHAGAEAAFEKGAELGPRSGSEELLAYMARRWQFDEILQRVRQAVRENRREWAFGVASVGEHFEKNYSNGVVEVYEAALALGASHAAELGFSFLVEQHEDKKALEWARAKKPQVPYSLAKLASRFPYKSDEARELYAEAASQGHVDSVVKLVKWDGSDEARKERLAAWRAEHRVQTEPLAARLRDEGEKELADFAEQGG